MKTKLVSLFILAAAAVLLSGCANALVPKGEVSGAVAGVPFKVKTPKDISIDKLTVSAATNGVASITIKGLKANMNPTVVQMSGDAFVNGVNATGNQIISGVRAGAEAFATGGGSALVKSAPASKP